VALQISNQERPIPPAPASRPAHGPQTVLVVDDDARVRRLLERMLQKEGIRVLTAEDGNAAVAAVASEPPDLILLDIVMPGLGGFEVCRRLKGQPETRLIPVVLVTGLDARDDRIMGIEAGADDFLSKPFDRAELLARIRSLLRVKEYTDELEQAESVLISLGRAVEERDPYTHGHCRRLADLGSRLGRRLGLPEDRLRDLERAGYLHDIGKITVPDAILHKQGPLTPEEADRMRTHPVAGVRICEGLRSLRHVLPIIRHHHERLDGSGYPDGLTGDRIPLGARILQVVDVYDALTTDRPYRRALDHDTSMGILRGEVEKGWWDPTILSEFEELIAESGPD
jgi:putative two-component system response regulator